MLISSLADSFSKALPTPLSVGAATLINLSGAGAYEGPVQTSPAGFCFVALQRQGLCSVRQSGRTAQLQPGDMTVYVSALPYQQLVHSDFRQTVLVLPEPPLRLAWPGLLSKTAVTLHSELAPVLASMADSYFSVDYAALPRQVAELAASALQDAVAACLLAAAGVASPERSHIGQYHLHRIRQYVLGNLGNPELSVGSVAAALGLSTAHLHRLFSEEQQTFSTWLWDARMEACHAALRDPAQAGRSISQIAFSHGFSQAAHFSRAFRSRYGMTASAWRQARD